MSSRIVLAAFMAISGLFTAASGAKSPKAPEISAKAKTTDPRILTPPTSPKPRINGAKVFGVRPGNPFLFKVPATGKKPLNYSAEGLPAGLSIDPKSGIITGTVKKEGTYNVTLKVSNELATATRDFRIIVGDDICLTPPMGWNSWYCWSESVSDEKIRAVAEAFVEKGLIDHGWTYVNIDDCWQGRRGGSLNAIQGNERFPDMKEMCDYIHSLGLKVGIYSTPWMGSYAGFIGASAPTADGDYSKYAIAADERIQPNQFFGRYPGTHKAGTDKVGPYWFADADAKQWAQWGFDFVKYDWKPNDVPTTKKLLSSLENCGRDIVFSISNATPFSEIPELSKLVNLWRTTGDIQDRWDRVSSIGFGQGKWRPFAGPGRYNDPDMLQVGMLATPNNFVLKLRPTRLTTDEQYSQVSLWSLQAAPLLLSCDIASMDDFTLSLLTNDEVIEVNQDPLCIPAQRASVKDQLEIWVKPLEDGSIAVGLFNRSNKKQHITVDFADIKRASIQKVRDLWRQKDLGKHQDCFTSEVNAHGVVLIKLAEVK